MLCTRDFLFAEQSTEACRALCVSSAIGVGDNLRYRVFSAGFRQANCVAFADGMFSDTRVKRFAVLYAHREIAFDPINCVFRYFHHLGRSVNPTLRRTLDIVRLAALSAKSAPSFIMPSRYALSERMRAYSA